MLVEEPPGPTDAYAVVEVEDGADYRVTITGELDVAALAGLRAVAGRYRASGARDVEVDLSGVSFLDSAGLAWFVRLHPVARAKRGVVVVRGATSAVWRVFELTGVHLLVTRTDG